MTSTRILLRRNTALTLRKLRPLAIMMTVAISLLLVVDSVVAAGITKYSKSVTDESSLNMVQASSVAPGAVKQITRASLEEFREIPDVAEVFGWAQVDLTIDDDSKWPGASNPGALWGTPYIPGLSPRVIDGGVDKAGPKIDEIILPDSSPFGDYSALLGQVVRFGYTQMSSPGKGTLATINLRVVGLYDNSTPGADGSQPSYISPLLLEQIVSSRQFGNVDMSQSRNLPFDRAFIRPVQPESVNAIQTEVSHLGYGVYSIANQLDTLPGLFKMLSLVTWLIGIFLVLFCIGVGVAIGGSWVQQRIRDVGILKAVGWSGGAIAKAFCLELAIVGGLIGAAGMVIGIAGALVTTTIVSGLDLQLLMVEPWTLPNPAWSVAAAIVVPVCLCLGALRSALRLARVDADSALRDL